MTPQQPSTPPRRYSRRPWLREAGAAALVLAVTLLALFLAYQSPASYSVDVPEPRSTVELEGAYVLEENAELGPYRWTPERMTIHLRPIGAPARVKVRLVGWRPTPGASPEVVFSLDGRELARVQTSNTPQDVDLSIPRGEAWRSGFDLQLSAPTFQSQGDARELGVVLLGVEATAGGEGLRPVLPNRDPLWQVALAALMVYAGLRRGGGRRLMAALFTVTGALLLAGAFALDRAFVGQWTWLAVVAGVMVLMLGAYWRALAGFTATCIKAIRSGVLPSPPPDEPAQMRVPFWLTPLLLIAAVVVMLLHPLSALLPEDTSAMTNYRWGLDFYLRLPGLLAWAGVMAALLFMVPQVNVAVRRSLAPARTLLAGPNPYLLLLLGAIGMSLILWLLRTRTLYGDGPELLRKLEHEDLWRERSPLDYYIHLKLAQALAGWGVTGEEVYRALSVIAGGLLVVAVALIACLIAPVGRRWLVAGLGLATGNLLLFAGYVESYTLAQMAGVWLLLALLLYVRGRAPAGVPATLLALAVWLHPSTLFLAPALAAGLLLKRASWAERVRDALAMVGAGLLVSLMVGSVFLVEGYSWERWEIARTQMGGVDPGTFKPMFETTGVFEFYPLVSLAHLGAVVQQQLLIAPLALVTCLAAAAAFRGRWAGRRELAALAIAASSTLLFSVTWNPDLGAANDWDLLSLPGIPLSLLAGGLLAAGWPPAADAEGRGVINHAPTARLSYIGSVLLVVAGWHALAWLLANALGL